MQRMLSLRNLEDHDVVDDLDFDSGMMSVLAAVEAASFRNVPVAEISTPGADELGAGQHVSVQVPVANAIDPALTACRSYIISSKLYDSAKSTRATAPALPGLCARATVCDVDTPPRILTYIPQLMVRGSWGPRREQRALVNAIPVADGDHTWPCAERFVVVKLLSFVGP